MRRDGAAGAEAETLAAYIDAVVSDREAPEMTDDALLSIARTLRTELRRIQPRQEFVDGLRLRLISAADQRVIPEEVPAAWRQPRFIIGAAGIVSAAAVIAFVARSRLQTRAAA